MRSLNSLIPMGRVNPKGATMSKFLGALMSQFPDPHGAGQSSFYIFKSYDEVRESQFPDPHGAGQSCVCR